MPVNPNRIAAQFRNFEQMLGRYTGRQPLPAFLTAYFKENRQMGSKDRRQASRWAYHLFRIGNGLSQNASVEDKLACGEFLCSRESDILSILRPGLSDALSLHLDEKIALAHQAFGFEIEHVFPLVDQLSSSIDKASFLRHFFVQPLLFIRVRPGRKAEVMSVLEEKDIVFEDHPGDALSLPNGTALDRINALKGLYQIQDYSSQQSQHFFGANPGEQWWDACAGSGGKSLLLLQQQPLVKLLVSDLRSSILRNLDERFDQAGIMDYNKKILDLTEEASSILHNETFDGVILDVPCSGAGTWARTPEMMRNFSGRHLSDFLRLQQRIISNVVPHLKKGKPLVYITCSAYAEENEGQVLYMEKELGLKVERMEVLHGYLDRADTMFMARLIKL